MSKHRRTGRVSKRKSNGKGVVLLLSTDKLRRFLASHKRAHTLRIQTEDDPRYATAHAVIAVEAPGMVDTARSHVMRVQTEE